MKRLLALTGAGLLCLTTAACSNDDPLSTEQDNSGETKTLVVGSQDYYSNEIVAEIYAQALEADGYNVDRQFRIGQREVYVPEIENGKIDLFPEYTGPLLQYWKSDTEARLADDVYAELEKATPEGLRVLDQSPATDQDTYVVTKEFADKWDLHDIADLAKVDQPMVMGANSEGENRPNGPKGLESTYGVKVGFTPIEDSGGKLTVKALTDGDIQLAIMYTGDPTIQDSKLVPLKDTKGLFLASHLVPVASKNVDEKAAETINKISMAMSAEDLVALNARSVNEQLPAATIASDWLKSAKM